MTKLITLSLILCLLALVPVGCHKKVNNDPTQQKTLTADDVLRGAKTAGKTAAVALNEGIALESTLAANGTIPPDIEPKIRQWLQDGKRAVDDFNERIAKYDHLDGDSKKLIGDFLEEALGFIGKLYTEGVLRIHNPDSQRIAVGILSGARLALTLYKVTMFDEIR